MQNGFYRPFEHYRQVHEHDEESKQKEKVFNIQPPSSFSKNGSFQDSQNNVVLLLHSLRQSKLPVYNQKNNIQQY